jgi:hypothetical protein
MRGPAKLSALRRLRQAASWRCGSTPKGRLTHPPPSRAEVTGQAIRAAVVTPAALALLLADVSGVISLLLDKYRLALWEADWLAVEPQWTHKR